MTQLVLNPEQVQWLSDARELVELIDANGRVLGDVCPGFSVEEIRLAQQVRTSNQATASTDEVLNRLRESA